jgi:hypothetical protein
MAIKLGKPSFLALAILCAIALTLQFFVDMPALADTLFVQTTSQPTLGSKISLTNDNNFPLWANMIEGAPWKSNSEWDRFEPYLEGGFLEAFVLNWGNGYFSPNTIENQLKQAQKWLENGNDYIAGAPGNSTNRDEQARFALATYLLIANGNKAYFSYSDRSNLYDYFWEYPEYYFNFGNPIEPYQQVSENPKVLRRAFECGSVEVDLTNKVPRFNYSPCNANPS